MKLAILERKRYEVAAYVLETNSGETSRPALDELRALSAKHQGAAKGMVALFKVYAENGRGRPYGVTIEQMHHAHYDPDIYEFRKGDIRVFCFLDGNRVVLTNSGLKKGKKANRKDVQKAISIKAQYFADIEQNDMQLEEK